MRFADRWNQLVYTLWAPVYDALLRFHPVSRIRGRAFKLLNIKAAPSVLLVGAGTGADLPFLNPSSLIVAADISVPMLRRSIARAQQLRVPTVSICCDAARLPYADNTFDAVVLTLIVSVVPAPQACLAEAIRVLRPDGRILVLDKFLPTGQHPSLTRTFLNLLIRPFGTEINRRWEDISLVSATTLLDEAAGPGGSMRTIVVQKSTSVRDDSELR